MNRSVPRHRAVLHLMGGLVLGLLGLLGLTADAAAGPARAQAVTVEWGAFASPADSALVFNAYVPADTTGRVAALYLPWPLDGETQPPALRDFLRTLGVSDRERQIIASALDLALFQQPTDGRAWDLVLAQLRTLETVLARGGVVRFRELTDDLQHLYAVRGGPTARDPRFPHLQGGYLVAYGPDGRLALDGLTLDFGEVNYTQTYTDTVQVANLGRWPAAVTTAEGQDWGRGFIGPTFTLAPGERRAVLITFKPYLYARETRSAITVRYVGGEGPGVVLRVAGGRRAVPIRIGVVHAHLWSQYPWYRVLLGVVGGSLILFIVQLVMLAVRTLGGRRLPRTPRRTWQWRPAETRPPASEAEAALWTRASAGLAAAWEKLRRPASEPEHAQPAAAAPTGSSTGQRSVPAEARTRGNGEVAADPDALRLRREHALKRAVVSREAVPRRGLRPVEPDPPPRLDPGLEVSPLDPAPADGEPPEPADAERPDARSIDPEDHSAEQEPEPVEPTQAFTEVEPEEDEPESRFEPDVPDEDDRRADAVEAVPEEDHHGADAGEPMPAEEAAVEDVPAETEARDADAPPAPPIGEEAEPASPSAWSETPPTRPEPAAEESPAEESPVEPSDTSSIRIPLLGLWSRHQDTEELEAQCLAELDALRAMIPPGVGLHLDRKAVRQTRRVLKKLIRHIDREMKKVEVPHIEQLDQRNAARNVRDILGEKEIDKQILMLWIDNLEAALRGDPH